MTADANTLTDLFDNYELIINNLGYPDTTTLYGEQVKEFLAYKLMKLEAQIKCEV
jgi:hypothetical protein